MLLNRSFCCGSVSLRARETGETEHSPSVKDTSKTVCMLPTATVIFNKCWPAFIMKETLQKHLANERERDRDTATTETADYAASCASMRTWHLVFYRIQKSV